MNLEKIVLVLMVAVGAAAWWLFLTPTSAIDTRPLAALPTRVESWEAQDLPIEEAVEQILQADFNLQREYRRAEREAPIWLYVGYYGTERGGRPEHTPDVCYPSAGWEIVEESTVVLDATSGFRGVEYIVELEGDRRLVYFWYRSGTRTGFVGLRSLALEHLRGRIVDGRADGALVRVSTPIEADGLEAVRQRLGAFATRIDSQIGLHWPEESPGH